MVQSELLNTPKYPERLAGLLKVPARKLYIDGKWVEAASGRTFDAINPSTGEALAQLAEGGKEDIDCAVDAARRAFEGPWRKLTPSDRQRLLLRLADVIERNFDDLRLLDVVDMGAPISRPNNGSFQRDILHFYASTTRRIFGETVPNSIARDIFSYTRREPVGVVGSIIPWNNPINFTLMKIAPIIATGCTVVIKPAEEASLSPLRITELLQELDLPPGVVNVVTGPGESAGAALSQHPDVDKIGFTGSSAVGRQVVCDAARSNLKRVSLELGGKSPIIVFADADLDAAVPAVAMGFLHNSGQSCSAGSRIFVERPIHEEFLSRLTDFVTGLRMGNSLSPDTQLGPLISLAQLTRVTEFLESARDEGARAVTGGARLTGNGFAEGYFVAPTVYTDVRDDMRIIREEIFGPVASVLPFDTEEEASRRANNSKYGLGAGIWTRDVGRAHRMVDTIRTGMVWVNAYNALDPAMPFGGVKTSGWGRELSEHSLDEYLNLKSVYIARD
jgi:aldehyde dehydrogenase (NAD+)